MNWQPISRASIMSPALTVLLVLFLTSFLESGALLVLGRCSSSCGEISSIRYPFRLKGDPSGCGDPNYELVCRGNKTILEISSVEYYVTDISYKHSRLQVVGKEWASGGVCALPSRSISPESTHKMSNSYSTDNTGWATFMKCSEEIHRSK